MKVMKIPIDNFEQPEVKSYKVSDNSNNISVHYLGNSDKDTADRIHAIFRHKIEKLSAWRLGRRNGI